MVRANAPVEFAELGRDGRGGAPLAQQAEGFHEQLDEIDVFRAADFPDLGEAAEEDARARLADFFERLLEAAEEVVPEGLLEERFDEGFRAALAEFLETGERLRADFEVFGGQVPDVTAEFKGDGRRGTRTRGLALR